MEKKGMKVFFWYPLRRSARDFADVKRLVNIEEL
jgi:hypothetical protein